VTPLCATDHSVHRSTPRHWASRLSERPGFCAHFEHTFELLACRVTTLQRWSPCLRCPTIARCTTCAWGPLPACLALGQYILSLASFPNTNPLGLHSLSAPFAAPFAQFYPVLHPKTRLTPCQIFREFRLRSGLGSYGHNLKHVLRRLKLYFRPKQSRRARL